MTENPATEILRIVSCWELGNKVALAVSDTLFF
jgi:hypothetical protein